VIVLAGCGATPKTDRQAPAITAPITHTTTTVTAVTATTSVAPPKPLRSGTVIFNLRTYPGSPYPPGAKVVALSFDDGPSLLYTPEVLGILLRYHVPASFEIIGAEGADNPGLLHQEVADGMTLVNHTWNHQKLTTLTAPGWVAQVDRTDRLLSAVMGHAVICLRPPEGYTDPAVIPELARRGLAVLMWDVDPSDYLEPPASVIAQRVLSAVHPGAVVILHDGGGNRSNTVAALPAIITGIRRAGYSLVQVCGP
jgi:peptidoglycan/xylan/chitin deacetylase (PgdA/CDA1 family)